MVCIVMGNYHGCGSRIETAYLTLALVHLTLNNVGRLVSASIQFHLRCWSI
jgi:hypothetical protein